VNSACFGVSRTITRLDQAVSYLGMELIKNLALTVHVFASLEKTAMRSGFSFEAQQERSLLTARVARRLLSDPGKAQDAFTAGLLHEIGNLILAVCIPAKFNAVVEACRVTGRPQHEVEIEIIGVSHAEVGAYLLGDYRIPLSKRLPIITTRALRSRKCSTYLPQSVWRRLWSMRRWGIRHQCRRRIWNR